MTAARNPFRAVHVDGYPFDAYLLARAVQIVHGDDTAQFWAACRMAAACGSEIALWVNGKHFARYVSSDGLHVDFGSLRELADEYAEWRRTGER